MGPYTDHPKRQDSMWNEAFEVQILNAALFYTNCTNKLIYEAEMFLDEI